jgi:phosphohistidine swiveling domain-containing protein
MNEKLILNHTDPIELFHRYGGGKAANLAELSQKGYNVPSWICITCTAFSHLESPCFRKTLKQELEKFGLGEEYVAVRSSGIGEDSSNNSFAGIHSSYLFQKGLDAILQSIKQCQASCFSERAMEYRKQQKLSLTDIRTGVIIQKMVNSEISGVAFSRDPLSLNHKDRVVVNSVWGVGEGLMNGEIEADLFYIHRNSLDVSSKVATKESQYTQGPAGGLHKIELSKEMQDRPSLTSVQAQEVAKMVMQLENHYAQPQDFEWAFAEGHLYCLQTRPISTLPPSAYYRNLDTVCLWDNSNIIESYSGVTTPLTFSFARFCYEEVYRQFCRVIAVPPEMIRSYEPLFKNMLGLLRGRIYYNLVNWYRLAILLPGASNNKEFMEIMMGVKQRLSPELSEKIGFPKSPQGMSFFQKTKLFTVSIWRFLTIKKIVSRFQNNFDAVYVEAKRSNFKNLSIKELTQLYQNLTDSLLKRWQAPIINDCLCMIFFGILKKLTQRWVHSDDPSLQNSLLCGEGGLESAEPTKMLMQIAEIIDTGEESFRKWFLDTSSDEIMDQLKEHSEAVHELFEQFLEKYGFRCVDELKLEVNDLHDDPTFVVDAVASYVRMKSYSWKEMEEREQKMRTRAESEAFSTLRGFKKWIFQFVLKNARRAIRDRENMRFARTKIFGVVRLLFRAMGSHLVQLNVLQSPSDIFYLTVDEIFSYIEGRSADLNLSDIATRRKAEFDQFRNSTPPPDRLLTRGPVGFSLTHTQLLSCDPLEDHSSVETEEPNTLRGTPCSPGIVEGIVRVVRDLKDARGLKGEILVTERTDPGWVPLYPSCSGLLIERGSLLSHSAIVARELGLPTVVGITGGLMQKLQTGMKVKMDATKGTVTIL